MRSPFELKSLIEWLEKQPAEAEYDYSEPRKCLLWQYFRHIGFEGHGVIPGFYRASLCAEFKSLPEGFESVASGGLFGPNGRTFGAALQRARLLDAQ